MKHNWAWHFRNVIAGIASGTVGGLALDLSSSDWFIWIAGMAVFYVCATWEQE